MYTQTDESFYYKYEFEFIIGLYMCVCVCVFKQFWPIKLKLIHVFP